MRVHRTSVIIVLVVILGGLALVLVTNTKPQLGLDLQGGYSVVLEPTDGQQVDSGTLDVAVEIIRDRVDALGVAEPSVSRQGNGIEVELPGVADREQACRIVGTTAKLEFRPVIATYPGDPDTVLQGLAQSAIAQQSATSDTTATGDTTATSAGDTTTTAFGSTIVPNDATTTTAAPTATSGSTASTASKSGGRDQTATTADAGATSTSAGSGASTVSTDATTASTTAADACGGTAAGSSSATTTSSTAGSTSTTAGSTTTTAAAASGAAGATTTAPGETSTTAPGETTTTAEGATTTTAPAIDPATARALVGLGDPDDPTATILVPGEENGQQVTYILGPRPEDATGEIVDSAEARLNTNGSWYVLVDFTGSGGATFDSLAVDYSSSSQTKQMAIVLDHRVVSAPVLETTSFNGSAQISGTFSKSDARELALVLRYGALPVELHIVTQQQVSATLGRDQLRAGIAAGIVGFILVALYMLFWYRVLGLVIIATLGLTAASMYVVVAWLGETQGVTLTLAGVTGLIVSVGLAVDSNIVYFERLKDEVKHGATVRSSAQRGFRKAFRTIIAADIVSLLAAVLLWLIAVGSVRGFAFYLGLATLIDLVLTYAFMHPTVSLLVRNRRIVQAPRFGIATALHADQIVRGDDATVDRPDGTTSGPRAPVGAARTERPAP